MAPSTVPKNPALAPKWLEVLCYASAAVGVGERGGRVNCDGEVRPRAPRAPCPGPPARALADDPSPPGGHVGGGALRLTPPRGPPPGPPAQCRWCSAGSASR